MFKWTKKNKQAPVGKIPRGRGDTTVKDNPLSHRFATSEEPPTEQMEEAIETLTPMPRARIPEVNVELVQSDDPETVLFSDENEDGQSDEMKNPVTGWLVIIEGPGRGASLKIGLGVNSVGRGADQRIRIDYGDAGISRENHCLITFDPKATKFYIQHGEGQNLTYLEGEPVLAPTALPALAQIQLSDTHLLFTPFCGEHFSWNSKTD